MRTLINLLVVLALGACASTHALKETDRRTITIVTVSPEVKVAPELYYFGPGTSVAMLFGAVGGAAAMAANKAPADELKEFAKVNGISIEDIVRKEFVAQLQTARKFRVSEDNANAVFRLDVSQYGLSVPTGLSSGLVPILTVRAELLNKKGEVIWADTERVRPLSVVVDSVSPETIRGNPQILRSMWTEAAQQVVLDMLKTL
jgi:hypothetical protein